MFKRRPPQQPPSPEQSPFDKIPGISYQEFADACSKWGEAASLHHTIVHRTGAWDADWNEPEKHVQEIYELSLRFPFLFRQPNEEERSRGIKYAVFMRPEEAVNFRSDASKTIKLESSHIKLTPENSKSKIPRIALPSIFSYLYGKSTLPQTLHMSIYSADGITKDLIVQAVISNVTEITGTSEFVPLFQNSFAITLDRDINGLAQTADINSLFES